MALADDTVATWRYEPCHVCGEITPATCRWCKAPTCKRDVIGYRQNEGFVVVQTHFICDDCYELRMGTWQDNEGW